MRYVFKINYSVKMKVPCFGIQIVLQLAATANCCLLDINMAVENAFISCSTNNVLCNAECYRGYIFPSRSTKESYSCHNGIWTPMLTTCKRIPLVSVTYLAIWTFIDVLPSTCKDISSRLDSLKDKLANYCRFLNINATVQFTYSFVAFQVNTQFKAVYQNFTSKYYLDVCIEYAIISIPSLQLVKTLFDGVSCGNVIASNTTLKNLFVSDMFEYCNDNMEVHNMTAATDGENELFCDFTGNMTTVETTIHGNTTAHSTTSSETITNEFTNMHQTTNSVFVKQTTSDISEWKTRKTTFL